MKSSHQHGNIVLLILEENLLLDQGFLPICMDYQKSNQKLINGDVGIVCFSTYILSSTLLRIKNLLRIFFSVYSDNVWKLRFLKDSKYTAYVFQVSYFNVNKSAEDHLTVTFANYDTCEYKDELNPDKFCATYTHVPG